MKNIWEFLGGLTKRQEMPDYLKALPEPKSNISKDCLAYIEKLFTLTNPAEKEACEREHIIAMKIKYPHLNWHRMRP
jgi:hypothetical protein